MPSGRVGRFRCRLLFAAAAPLIPAGVAVAAPDAGLVAVGVGLVAAAAAAAGLWTLTRPLAELAAAGSRVGRGEPAGPLPTDRGDEIGLAADAITALESRMNTASAERDDTRAEADDILARFAETLDRVAAGLARVTDPAQPAAKLALGVPAAVSADKVTAAYRDLAEKVGAVRQRANTAIRILQTCPVPLVSTDDRGGVRYMNPAAEQAFGKPLAQAMRGPLGNLVHPLAGDPDPLDRPGLPPEGVAAWLARGGTPVLSDTSARGRRFQLAAARSVVQNDGMWCVTARDTADEYARLAADRAQVRADTLTAAWAAADAAAGESAEVILAQTRMLTGEAKQSPHREIFLPRLTAVRDYASDLDIQFQLTRWLTASFGGELPASRPVEFLAGEVARGAVGQLALRMKARNNTFSVADQGGWVCCDEDRLRTAVLGVLSHACAANRDAVIGVRLRKLAGGPSGREGQVAVEVIDAGPRLTSDQLRALDEPFGGLAPAALLPAVDGDGFVPGLLLAKRLATALGGALEFDATPSDRLVVRLVAPSWLPDRAVPAVEPAADGNPPEELCLGWRLGAAG